MRILAATKVIQLYQLNIELNGRIVIILLMSRIILILYLNCIIYSLLDSVTRRGDLKVFSNHALSLSQDEKN